MTPAMKRAIADAADRPRGNYCPTRGVHAAASDALVDALDRRGFVYWDGLSPRINQAARDAIASGNRLNED